ncbi:hypothetical protein VB773_09710 [Haloarculaceae archaeon H-GB2-1]|nr:hypothetical protein [Haloarculaceae archaeon H-GB1-1]MEA5386310.1 hypothetical protein [Haloarculaceae archaeon H-GB11]MEA5407812.1 hypothetical protein [Haloarculaceae archaeon H-GB2-1]
MDHLAPSNVPVYSTRSEATALWSRCADRGQPVLAVRDARRGFIVHYDLQHLGKQLKPRSVQRLRERIRNRRPYPTETDPVSEAEAVGGEAGAISGELHAPTERDARQLASHLSVFVLDDRHLRDAA